MCIFSISGALMCSYCDSLREVLFRAGHLPSNFLLPLAMIDVLRLSGIYVLTELLEHLWSRHVISFNVVMFITERSAHL